MGRFLLEGAAVTVAYAMGTAGACHKLVLAMGAVPPLPCMPCTSRNIVKVLAGLDFMASKCTLLLSGAVCFMFRPWPVCQCAACERSSEGPNVRSAAECFSCQTKEFEAG